MPTWEKCTCGKSYDSEKYTSCFLCSQQAKGLELCPKCQKQYFDPKKYAQCFTCTMEEKGWKQCPVCQKGWFDPEAYKMCYKCNQTKMRLEAIK